MTVRCPWCLNKHTLKDCPSRPKSREEVRDELAERMMRYRAAKNALLGYARNNGFPFPASILALDPDYTA